MSVTVEPVVVTLETDLFFSVRIEDVVRTGGARPVIVGDANALWEAIDAWPDLVLIDLTAAPGWDEVVRRARSESHTRSIPIIAFGSHVDTESLRVARAAGCDHAWARSRFMAELPNLVQTAIQPPTRWVDGWDEPPPAALLKGIEQFNAGEFWECHETLELLWREERRPVRDLYQGILQTGVAFYHLIGRNYVGAVKVFRRGLTRLRGLPATCQGVHVAELALAARATYDAVLALGPERLEELDLSALPHIQLDGYSESDADS